VLGGTDGLTGNHSTWDGIERHSQLIIAFGGLPWRNAQIQGGGAARHEAAAALQRAVGNGARLINVSPVRDDAPRGVNTEWLPLRPNSDTALMLALCHVLIDEGRHDVSVDAWNAATGQRERWIAARVVLAVPVFVAARVLAAPPAALSEAARLVRHAPWLVANLQLDSALEDRPGAAPSWDNVVYGSSGLGYVDAMHQSTRPYAAATVLTAYFALGAGSDAALAEQRRRLLDDDWRSWSARVIADIAPAHPDLAAKVRRVDLMRYGHAMSIPVPGARSSAALQALAAPQRRVHFAHADLSAYSVFEEAFCHGMRAGRAAAGLR